MCRRVLLACAAAVLLVSVLGSPTVAGAETLGPFGIESFTAGLSETGGGPFALAGGHPDALTTEILLDTTTNKEGLVTANGIVKDVTVQLPPGLVGNPTAAGQCSRYENERFQCKPEAQIGIIAIRLSNDDGKEAFVEPLFNLVPEKGVAAEFGARVNDFVNAFIQSGVRTGGDYGIDAASMNITTLSAVTGVRVVVWGVPGAAAHDPERSCPYPESEGKLSYENGPEQHFESLSFEGPVCSHGLPERSFLTDPSSCGGVLSSTAVVDSYQEPKHEVPDTVTMSSGMTGCGKVKFDPGIAVEPTTRAADAPAGLRVDLRVPQEENPAKRATSDLRDASVTLPAGLVVNPSSADGLEGCSERDVGFEGRFAELDPVSEPGVQTPQFSPSAAECPGGSKLGTVVVHTPLLAHPLEGGLYLATPHENPFGSLLGLYLAVDDEASGVVLKLPGRVVACENAGEEREGVVCEAPGQLTAVFDQNPQLPFEDLEVNLFGANEDAAHSRARLTTPLQCGSYQATSLLEPWSHKPASGEAQGTPDATPTSVPSFPIEEGCVGQESEAPNKPAFEAGTASPVAGSYSPFVLKLSREDGSQRFGALNVTLPPGLLGKVAGVEQCPQADIEKAQSRSHEGEGAIEQNNPSCPSGSEVGTVHVGAGSGAPFYVTGKAYFAGPYEGAPFSLVIVTPAIAGPFDLGTVVVRAGLFINPTTAQVTVKSDPFPTILDGIPLDIRTIGVEINRSGFTLNPTSCDAMSLTGEEQSTTGNVASLSDKFKAEGCGTLPFHPSFTASTQAKTSKADGASLKVNVGSSGVGVADIAKVDLTIPKILPARLTTLQQACTEAQFNANPAGCPAGSDIGMAVVHTPILSSPLSGPAYLVSHGGAAFPDVEMVLQGEGVTLILDGKTDIKGGVTYSRFESVPDAPFTTFEFDAPEGPHSIFTVEQPGTTNLCAPTTTKTVTVKKKVRVKTKHGGHKTVTRKVKKTESVAGPKITIPTTLVGQNGVEVHQETPVSVSGCAAVSSVKAHKKSKKKGSRKKKK